MSVDFSQLLEAAIQHLEGLKERGVRFVPVSEAALRSLGQPVTRKHARPAAGAEPRQSILPASQRVVEPAPVKLDHPAAPAPAPILEPASAVPVAAADSVLTPDGKAAALASLRARALACVKCSNLAAARQNVVFGVGNPNAELMFVGEAPGADEDARGEPFVGAAGQLLTKVIKAMGLARDQVYIANILKCRPDTPGQRTGNRKPTPAEMQTCIGWLHEQIDIVRPRVLVALGGTAIEGLLGQAIPVGRIRGRWQTYRGTPLMPTFHPAYLLHQPSMTDKRRLWEDMLMVMGRLEMPISEKQRNYFLTAG
jgi:DNA polymerase